MCTEPQHQSKKTAVGRCIGLALAIVCLCVSIWLGREALRMNADFHRWIVDRPMQTEIDLSQPAETVVPFRQTCSSSHGESLCLSLGPDHDLSEDSLNLLEELSGTLVISDSHNVEVASANFSERTAWLRDDQLVLANLDTFQRGDFVARIRIESGAPALAGKQQTLYARYQLCGLEQMPAVVAGVLTIVSLLVTAATACFVLPGLYRYGFRQWPQSEETPEKTD